MEKMFLSLLGWKPYRCGTCDLRFYLEAKQDAVGELPAASRATMSTRANSATNKTAAAE
jgi:hypothetical protein